MNFNSLNLSLFVLGLFLSPLLEAHILFSNPKGDRFDFQIATTPEGQETKYDMRGYRYLNKGGPPLLLAHGFFNKGKSLDEWARYYHRQGYDVWVFDHLGFGDSRILEGFYEKGDYGYMSLLKGMDLVIKNIVHFTNKKINYVSFSMGGMTFHRYVAGAYAETKKGELLTDESISRERQSYIAGAVTLGAPVDSLSGVSKFFSLGAKLISGLLRTGIYNRRHFIHFGFTQSDNPNHNIASLGFKIVKDIIPRWILKQALKEVMTFNGKSYDKDTIKVLAEGFSNMHIDIIYSIAKLAALNKALDPVPFNFPYQAIIGEKDRLARFSPLLEWNLKAQNLSPDNHALVIKAGDGHLNLLYGYFVKEIAPLSLLFLKSVKDYLSLHGPISYIGELEKENYIEVQNYHYETKKRPYMSEYGAFHLPENKNLRAQCRILFKPH